MNVLVVIVCYRAVDLTIDCLRSLRPEIETVPGTKVAVCENGTGGDAAVKLARAIEDEGWGEWVSLKVIHPNRGFAGGNNVILREAMAWPDPPRYFLLLNADTIVRPGALATLYGAAERTPDVAVVSPRLEWPDGEPQISCFRYINPVSELLESASTAPLDQMLQRLNIAVPVSDEPIEPEWTSFACALIPQLVMQDIGVLDEGYYLYFDDVDFCRRARQVGKRVLHVPAARVVHLRGRSNPVKSLTAQRKRRPDYWYASRARYYAKFHGRPGLLAANLCWMLGRSLSLAREWVGHKAPHTCEKEGLDIWRHWWRPLKPPTRAEATES